MTSIQGSIQSLANSINPKALDKAAQTIANCKTVNFGGVDASSSMALDAQHTFFRFGMPVDTHTEFINQRMMCSMIHKDDVVVFISYAGRTDVMIINA